MICAISLADASDGTLGTKWGLLRILQAARRFSSAMSYRIYAEPAPNCRRLDNDFVVFY
jgi:hypothetical protein